MAQSLCFRFQAAGPGGALFQFLFGLVQGFHGAHQIGGLFGDIGFQIGLNVDGPLGFLADIAFQIAYLGSVAFRHLAGALLVAGQLLL